MGYTSRLLFVAVGLSYGCVENAVLEMHLLLPPDATTDTPVYANLQVRDDTLRFDNMWSGAEPVRGFLLEQTSRTEQVSIVALPEDFERSVHARLRFCSTDQCTGLGNPMMGIPGDDSAPELRLVIEHPFYSLKRTRVRWEVPVIPSRVEAVPVTIPKCQVEGCTDGSAVMYCRVETMRHFCEDD